SRRQRPEAEEDRSRIMGSLSERCVHGLDAVDEALDQPSAGIVEKVPEVAKGVPDRRGKGGEKVEDNVDPVGDVGGDPAADVEQGLQDEGAQVKERLPQGLDVGRDDGADHAEQEDDEPADGFEEFRDGVGDDVRQPGPESMTQELKDQLERRQQRHHVKNQEREGEGQDLDDVNEALDGLGAQVAGQEQSNSVQLVGDVLQDPVAARAVHGADQGEQEEGSS